MAKDTLTITISPVLQDAMGIRAQNGVDYFTLLGVKRGLQAETDVEQGVLERSRTLRKWQNSPQYGPEVVKLLTTLHKAGKILKDPARRTAYLQQLERIERGETASAVEEFTSLVRAAMADGALDANAKRELGQFADQQGVNHAEAQKIVARVREEMEAKRQAEAAKAKEENWEFRIAEEGEEGFGLTLAGLESAGEFTEETPKKMLGEAGRYGITPQRAAQIMAEFQKHRFQRMIKRVAHGGVINDAQSRLLLSKASAYGLEQRQAYEIISDYTLSAHSTDEALKRLLLAETFKQDDIDKIVADKATKRIRRRPTSMDQVIPDWLRNMLLLVVGVGVLGFLGYWVYGQFSAGGSGKVIERPDQDITRRNLGGPPVVDVTPAPNTAEEQRPQLNLQPDPPSGVLLFTPQKPDDPPPFEMSINEVTCAQYQEFLRSTLEEPPPGWNGNQPPGPPNLPVSNVPWKKAMAWCAWQTTQRGLPANAITLPSHAEFLRAARGQTTKGNPASENYWSRARLWRSDPLAIRMAQVDKIYVQPESGNLFNKGQIYDLLGNVAEWGREAQNGQAAVLGGDYGQSAPGFNPLQARWTPPDTVSPTIGFRCVQHRNP